MLSSKFRRARGHAAAVRSDGGDGGWRVSHRRCITHNPRETRCRGISLADTAKCKMEARPARTIVRGKPNSFSTLIEVGFRATRASRPDLPARVVLTGHGYYFTFIPCSRETHPCLLVCHERLDKRGEIYTSAFAGTADISSECLHARVCLPLQYLLNACNPVELPC